MVESLDVELSQTAPILSRFRIPPKERYTIIKLIYKGKARAGQKPEISGQKRQTPVGERV